MKRSEIWTLRDDNYASKARPVVIVQSDTIEEFESVVVALLTTFERPSALTRVVIEPSDSTGLEKTSYVMTEKLLTVRRSELRKHVGTLDQDRMRQIARAIATVLAISKEDLD